MGTLCLLVLGGCRCPSPSPRLLGAFLSWLLPLVKAPLSLFLSSTGLRSPEDRDCIHL